AAQAEELGAREARGTDAGEGFAAHQQEGRDARQRLHVVDQGRLAEDADVDGEGRLGARLAAQALHGVEERGLLAADVGAAATADLDVEGPAGAQHVGAQVPARARRLDSRGQATRGQDIL